MRVLAIAAVAALFATSALPAFAEEAKPMTIADLATAYWKGEKPAGARVVSGPTDTKIIGGWTCKPTSPGKGVLGTLVGLEFHGTTYYTVHNSEPVKDYAAGGKKVMVSYTIGFTADDAAWKFASLDEEFKLVNAGSASSEGDAPAGCDPL